MKILFLSHCYRTIHHLLVKEMKSCLEIYNHKVISKFNSDITYDCILVFNRKELKKYQKVFDALKIPIVYLFCISDIAEEYPVLEHVTKIIVLKDKILNVQHLFSSSLIYQEMILPINKTELKIQKSIIPTKSNDKHLIYVNIDDEYFGGMTFLKLLSLFNQLQGYEIRYQSNKGIRRQFVNKNIRLINSKCDIEDCINQAHIVIASGYTAYLAVMHEKKTIVVGEKGYGGLVTEDSLEYHMANFFQGRNGGKFDEYIPFPLMAKAIETDMPDVLKIRDKLLFLQNKNQKSWIQLIEAIGSFSLKECIDLTMIYIFNPDYSLMKINKRIWIFKRIFRTLYKSINESESAVICAFQKPNSIHGVLSRFPAEYEKDIREYIDELIAKKILIRLELVRTNASMF